MFINYVYMFATRDNCSLGLYCVLPHPPLLHLVIVFRPVARLSLTVPYTVSLLLLARCAVVCVIAPVVVYAMRNR